MKLLSILHEQIDPSIEPEEGPAVVHANDMEKLKYLKKESIRLKKICDHLHKVFLEFEKKYEIGRHLTTGLSQHIECWVHVPNGGMSYTVFIPKQYEPLKDQILARRKFLINNWMTAHYIFKDVIEQILTLTNSMDFTKYTNQILHIPGVERIITSVQNWLKRNNRDPVGMGTTDRLAQQGNSYIRIFTTHNTKNITTHNANNMLFLSIKYSTLSNRVIEALLYVPGKKPMDAEKFCSLTDQRQDYLLITPAWNVIK